MNHASDTNPTEKPMTPAERRENVAQMNANFAIEGVTPGADDRARLELYAEGVLTVEDLLAHAHEFAAQAKKDGK